MKLLAVPVGLLGVLVACDGGGAGQRDLGITQSDSGAELAETNLTPDSDGMGTQVGSEGFWGCPIEALVVVDGATELEALGGSPADLVSRLVGEWPLQIVDDGLGEPEPGALALVDLGNYLWLDVAEGEGCVDHLAAEVTATVARSSTTTGMSGFVAIAPSAGRLLVTADGVLDDVAATWGGSVYPPDTSVTFRIDGELTPNTFGGAAWYVDCDPLEVVCATADKVADVDGQR